MLRLLVLSDCPVLDVGDPLLAKFLAHLDLLYRQLSRLRNIHTRSLVDAGCILSLVSK